MSEYTPTARTRVKRLAKRGVYDKASVHAILDEGFVCHLGFSVDAQPYVIPTSYARAGEVLFIHGSGASRTLKTLARGVDVCVTVTLIDGYVLARSAFHHSLNYRSVVTLGRATLVAADAERLEALRTITNHLVPGRWEELRAPTELELKQTIVLQLPLTEVSAKVRTGAPVDEEADYASPVWAGVVPVHLQLGEPVPDSRLHPAAESLQTGRFGARHGTSGRG